jgi:hypothetical protein
MLIFNTNNILAKPLGLFTVSKDGAIGALDVNTGSVLIKKPDAHE